jgi:cysteine desulfurase
LCGAGEEHGRRPGSENVPAIVGMGEACRIAAIKLESFSKNSRKLADQLFAKVKAYIPGTVIVGDPQLRLPNTLTLLFPEVPGGELLRECPQVAASDCAIDESEQPSRVLIAMGLPDHVARGAVRLSLGRNTTQQDVEAAAAHLIAAWHQIAQSGGSAISGRQSR